jgi:hypothetical protein
MGTKPKLTAHQQRDAIKRRDAGEREELKKNINLQLYSAISEDGLFILGTGASGYTNFLVIDESESHLFGGKSAADCLTIVQKLCRFSVRYWRKQRLNRNERILGNKAIVFPFPISNRTSYRVMIEREPNRRDQTCSTRERIFDLVLLARRIASGIGRPFGLLRWTWLTKPFLSMNSSLAADL